MQKWNSFVASLSASQSPSLSPSPVTLTTTNMENTILHPMIPNWAKLIQIQEGGRPDDLNMRLNNPGNLKYSTLTASWGAYKGQSALDGGFFCQFKSYDDGMNALVNFLTLGCEDELKAFHQSRTLLSFTKTFANPPSDSYAEGIARGLGVDVNVDISTFL